MVDSGATQCFIHKSLVDKFDIPTTTLRQPIALDVADGRPIKSGAITHKTSLVSMSVRSHHEKIDLFVTNIGQHSLILGTSWLKKHNPGIDWTNRTIDFRSGFCRATCMQKETTPFGNKKQLQPPTSKKPETSQSKSKSPTVIPAPEKSYNQEYTSVFSKPLPTPKPSIGTIGLRSLKHLINKRQVASIVALDLQTGEKLNLSTLNQYSSKDDSQMEAETSNHSIPEEFSEFADVFSKTSADRLPEHTQYDHTIPLEPGSKPPFGPILLLVRYRTQSFGRIPQREPSQRVHSSFLVTSGSSDPIRKEVGWLLTPLRGLPWPQQSHNQEPVSITLDPRKP
jgi:hypothetical protein